MNDHNGNNEEDGARVLHLIGAATGKAAVPKMSTMSRRQNSIRSPTVDGRIAVPIEACTLSRHPMITGAFQITGRDAIGHLEFGMNRIGRRKSSL